MAGFLDEKHEEIQARLKELKPLVDEYRELEAADKALSVLGKRGGGSTATSTGGPAPPQRARARRPPRPPAVHPAALPPAVLPVAAAVAAGVRAAPARAPIRH